MTQEPIVPALSAAEAAHVAEGSYDASAITVLEGLEAVRKRPGMYIGSTGERGLHHLVYEVVDNSVDEALAGYCDTITVELLEGGGIRGTDNGRGIPVAEHPVEKVSALTVALTMLHAGGKFGTGGYKVSGGLHGVGVSVVNALSTSLTADVWRDGYHWRQTFSLGVPDAPLERLEPADGTGTVITFYASADIFETTVYSWDTLATRFREMAFLNKGLSITLVDRRPEHADNPDTDEIETVREQTFQYSDGLIDYVKYLTGSREVIHPSVIAIDAVDDEMSLEVAMQWNTSYNESVHTFANTINTHEGGTHEEGFR
ncbi:MAG: ATP-binding protein, partial [Propionicimonas sp.]|nr:ATP-binding protein [Propionicimonas sp.]